MIRYFNIILCVLSVVFAGFSQFAHSALGGKSTPLPDNYLQALEAGDRSAVRGFLEAGGADVNFHFKTRHNQTPLIIAITNNHSRLVEELIEEYGADINAVDSKSRGALHHAVLQEDEDLVKDLLEYYKEADIDAPDDFLETPFHFAVLKKNEDLISVLCENGADINAKNKEGQSPLHLAVVVNLAITQQLLNCRPPHRASPRIEINTQDNRGLTPLHEAALLRYPLNRVRTLHYLLTQGASPNIQDNNGQTLFHYLAKRDYLWPKRSHLNLNDFFTEDLPMMRDSFWQVKLTDYVSTEESDKSKRIKEHFVRAVLIFHNVSQANSCCWEDHQGRSPIDIAFEHRNHDTVKYLQWVRGTNGPMRMAMDIRMVGHRLYDLFEDRFDDLEDWWDDDLEDWIYDVRNWWADRPL